MCIRILYKIIILFYLEFKMATQQANGSPSTINSTNNNGGSVVNAGDKSTVLSGNVTLGYYDTGVFGSTVAQGSYADVALVGGVFSYNNQNPVAKRTTDELSTIPNDFLISGALKPDLIRSINKLEVLRTRRLTTAIRDGEWNEYTGSFDTAPVVAVDVLPEDKAANPTRGVPGSLVYKSSSANPVVDTYKPKTS
jgi:hypothetical protein